MVIASESPDRECCDGPVYKLDPPGSGHHNLYPSYNYPPPEVPDFPEYGPHEQMPPRVPGYGPGIVFDEKLDQDFVFDKFVEKYRDLQKNCGYYGFLVWLVFGSSLFPLIGSG